MDEETALLSSPHPTATGTNRPSSYSDTADSNLVDVEPPSQHGSPQHRRESSSVFELALESVVEVKEAIVETLEEVQETVVHGLEEAKETVVHGFEEAKEILNEDIAHPVQPRPEGDHDQRLSATALAVLVFYKVSGGPFGAEPAVKAAGPFYSLLGFILFPLFWCIPEALITAELGAAYPEPSGAIAWVEEAFGPKASLLCGYFHWLSGATDNAIYPSLFLSYVASSLSIQFDTITRFIFTVVITMVLSIVNYTGLGTVGNLSMVVCVLSLSPFVILFLAAIPKIEPSRWFILPESDSTIVTDDDGVGFIAEPLFAGVHWRPLLNSLFWNMNSFDAGASFAGEVRNPGQVFPRAMFLSVFMVVASYIIPLTAGLGAMDSRQADWEAGYFATVATVIGGSWLGLWTVFAAAISNIALFEAEMSGDAYQLMGMADRGMLPKFFTKRSRFDTPENGIILNTLVIVLMSVANFEQLVEMLNFAFSLALLMEFAAFIKLRIDEPDCKCANCFRRVFSSLMLATHRFSLLLQRTLL